VAELVNSSSAENPPERSESSVRMPVGKSCAAPTATPTSPKPTTRNTVPRRGRIESISTAAERPVSSHTFGKPARAWMPQQMPAATSPMRVGLGRRTRGRRTQGIQE
jgi:hypothetical protein